MTSNHSHEVPWYRSLRFKLVAAAITVELVMLSALLFNSFRLLDQSVELQTQMRLEALSPLLDAALAGRVFQRDHTEVKSILTRLTTSSRLTEINYITVLDIGGNVIASTGNSDSRVLPREDHSVIEALTDLTYDVRLPLTIIGTEVGSVHFGLSLASMVATKDQVVREGIIIAMVEILLSILLLASGGYLITRHIRSLTEGTRRVAQGDYNVRIPISGKDEIAELANDFNAMSTAISTHVNDLRTSEMRSYAIFNAVSEAIFIHDAATGEILDVNQRMCEMYSCSREEALNMDVSAFSSGIHPYTLDGALGKIQAAVTGTPQQFEWHAQTVDGRTFWVEVSLRLAKIGDDDRLIAVVRDISDRKKADEEKNTAIARFKTLVDSLDALVYVADMESYELLFVNKYGRNIWGDISGKICWQALQKGQTGPCPFCTNAKLLGADGISTGVYVWELQNTVTNEWFECRDQVIQWTDGRPVRMEIATNITPRKAAEDALAAEKEQLSVTLRSIGDGVVTTDTDGRIILLNAVAENLTGWKQEEAQGRPLADVFNIIDVKTRKPCKNPVEQVMASGQITGLANHTALVAKDGREYNITDSGAPIRNRESEVVGVVLVFRDVTEKNRMEKELTKVKKLESVGVLAGGIAHDFNNILAAILGNINLAALDTNLRPETKKLLDDAEKASLRAKDLTQQLLTFSKGGEPIKQAASIHEVIKDSANFVLHGGNVACSYHIPDDLWLVEIDKGQISQVIQNVIINAKHAMPEGGVVNVQCENVNPLQSQSVFLPRDLQFVKVTITDSGIGMPANVVEKIFDPYFSTKQAGSGLGLAISHSIITKHNGHLAVKSTPGIGTSFSIFLPASVNQQEKEQKVESIEEGKGKAKIMIMDDEEMVRDIAKAMLSRMGHEVLLAQDGAGALELYREHSESGKSIDLVIMDLTIPGGMGGKDAVKEILAFDPSAKVIVSSGYSNDPAMANYQEYGFAAAVVKPYRLHDLTKVINRVLRN